MKGTEVFLDPQGKITFETEEVERNKGGGTLPSLAAVYTHKGKETWSLNSISAA